MIKKSLLIFVWLVAVFLAAKMVPDWRFQIGYDELLTESAKSVLANQASLKIEVFARPDSPAASLVNNYLHPLMSHLKDVQVDYVDFHNNPDLIKTYGISKQGEMVVHQGTEKFKLTTLSYEAFFNGLKRINQSNDQWIVFLEGIDGKPFDRGQNDSLSHWVQSLSGANYRSMVLPYDTQLNLPNSVKLIIMASPQKGIVDDDINWLQKYIQKGVGVLWLTDPHTTSHQPALSLLFDVMRTDAYHQGHLILKELSEHEINKLFDRPLDLFEAMPFNTNNKILWHNDQGEALAATQEIGNSRLMVIGDSDFLTDKYLNSGGNLEMSYRLVDWLLHQENRIDLPTLGMENTQLHFQKNEILIFAGLMLILLPGVFLVMAVYHWRKQK